MTILLRLLYGIPAIPTDSLSAEQGVEVISLASDGSGTTGWFLDETVPFIPKIASLKGGATWLDSPSEDGKVLQSSAVDNVVETVRLRLVGTFQSRYSYLSQINRFIASARMFHTTHYQTQPVQLEWWAEGAPGAQYALVYDMSIDVQRGAYDNSDSFDVTLTIEREPAWRGVLFGWPATMWTQYMRGNAPGAGYDISDLSLVSGDALVQSTVQNRHEFTGATGYDYDTPPVSKNWIDIDADMIPGDAPALCSIVCDYSAGSAELREMIIARSTKPRYWTSNDDGSKTPQFYTLNAGDAGVSLFAKTVGAASTGVISNGSSTQQYYALQAASIGEHFLHWGDLAGVAGKYSISQEAFRGRFAAFVRGRLNTTTPATFRLDYRSGLSVVTLIPSYQPAAPSSSTINIQFYLGDFSLPLSNRSVAGTDGRGLDVAAIEGAGVADLTLSLSVTPGNTTQSTRVIDLVLIPYDEGQAMGVIREATGSGGEYTYDNTGYIPRDTDPVFIYNPATTDRKDSTELIGDEITLLPGKDNRLYILFNEYLATGDVGGLHSNQLSVKVNIVPRWYGVRDV